MWQESKQGLLGCQSPIIKARSNDSKHGVRARRPGLGRFEADVRGVGDHAKLLGLKNCWKGIAVS